MMAILAYHTIVNVQVMHKDYSISENPSHKLSMENCQKSKKSAAVFFLQISIYVRIYFFDHNDYILSPSAVHCFLLSINPLHVYPALLPSGSTVTHLVPPSMQDQLALVRERRQLSRGRGPLLAMEREDSRSRDAGEPGTEQTVLSLSQLLPATVPPSHPNPSHILPATLLPSHPHPSHVPLSTHPPPPLSGRVSSYSPRASPVNVWPSGGGSVASSLAHVQHSMHLRKMALDVEKVWV